MKAFQDCNLWYKWILGGIASPAQMVVFGEHFLWWRHKEAITGGKSEVWWFICWMARYYFQVRNNVHNSYICYYMEIPTSIVKYLLCFSVCIKEKMLLKHVSTSRLPFYLTVWTKSLMIWRVFKEHWKNIWRPREWSSPVFILFPTMIYWKSLAILKNHIWFRLI